MEFSEPLIKFMSDNLSFSIRKKGNIAILDLYGKLIGSKALHLKDELLRLRDSGISSAVLNFQGVSSIDSLGVFAVLSGLESGVITKIFQMNTVCWDIFEQHSEAKVIPILGSEEEAIGVTNEIPVMTAEMRKYKRVTTNIPVEISLGRQLQPGVLLNVSEGGALIGYLDTLTEDQHSIRHINITMNLPVIGSIELEGKPVRFSETSDMHTVGVELLSTEKNWRILKQVCEVNTQPYQ